ncbi:MAG: hypothetical protein JO345_27065 [Streptosporangiaceae bacterium]|nr:hypothetical protein [Streptosporangiaceae bacterium]
MPDQPTRWIRIGLLAAAGVILITGATAAAVAVTAAVSPAQSRQYVALSGACALVRPTTLDKYLPGAIGESSGGPALKSLRTARCQWHRLNGGQPRTLSMTMTTFASAPVTIPSNGQAVSSIQPRSVSVFGTMWTDPQAIKEGARLSTVEGPVAGLGDSAKAMLMIVTPAGSGHPRLDGVSLDVVSGNADIFLSTAAIPAAFIHVPPADAARQFGLIAIAHDVLAALSQK